MGKYLALLNHGEKTAFPAYDYCADYDQRQVTGRRNGFFRDYLKETAEIGAAAYSAYDDPHPIAGRSLKHCPLHDDLRNG